MSGLVEDLLFLARSDAGAMPLELEVVNIELFLDQLAERATMLAGQYEAELHLDLAAEGLVQIDRNRMAQAMLNLVDNAGKYSPAGATITLRSVRNSTEFIVEVADQGSGIPEEEQPLIFERFYRIHKVRTRKTGGVGLGLPIAKSIITAHGGRIEVESTLGQGTTMRCYLPLVTITKSVLPSPEPMVLVDTV
jgi:signal transduction histidine kinase